jgi:hypothetical protein
LAWAPTLIGQGVPTFGVCVGAISVAFHASAVAAKMSIPTATAITANRRRCRKVPLLLVPGLVDSCPA